MKIRFGEYAFDPSQRLVTRGAEPVHLTPKAMRLLEVLIENRPRALAKAEIQNLVWPDVVVEEGNLKGLVAEIRRELDDYAKDPRFIRTVYGYGYAFVGERYVEEESDVSVELGAAHWVDYQGQRYMLRDGKNILGRTPGCSVFIDSRSVSRHHARITVANDRATLDDLSSKNGTYLNGIRIDTPVELADGAEFTLGRVSLTYHLRDLDTETPMIVDSLP